MSAAPQADRLVYLAAQETGGGASWGGKNLAFKGAPPGRGLGGKEKGDQLVQASPPHPAASPTHTPLQPASSREASLGGRREEG